MTRPGATVSVILSVTERDTAAGAPIPTRALFAARAGAYLAAGLALTDARPATVEEIGASHSSWARRIGAGAGRTAWIVRFERCAAPPVPWGVAR
jgi:16S rRNA (adenine(1408)-N(1))-methyltransferase